MSPKNTNHGSRPAMDFADIPHGTSFRQSIPRWRWLLPFCFMVFMSAALEAEPDNAREVRRQENRQRVEEWTAAMREAAEGNPDKLVQSGLLADRRRQRVRFWAETTGIEAGHAVEFVLISQRSGHDYEALAVSLVEPSAIHEALTFIGMDPGKPVDPQRLRFWPRGERVWVHFVSPPFAENEDSSERVAVENLLYNQHRQRPPPVEGFVFTGSMERPHPQTGDPVYAADHFGPHAIVSLYNEPFSVMDVPRLAAQSDVYGSITPNPNRLLSADTLVEVTLEPESRPEQPRVFLGRLHIIPARDATPPLTAGDLRFSIEPHNTDDRAPDLEHGNLVELLVWLAQMTENNRDPFIVMRPDTRLPWTLLREFYKSVQALEGDEGIRVEPPEDDRLYHRAFLPADWFRDRQQRTVHPDELHLHAPVGGNGNGLQAVWKRFEEEWPDTRTLDPILHVHRQPVENATDLLAHHQAQEYKPIPAVLLVFAPETVTLKTLHEWMMPLRETYPTQYILAPNTD